MSEHKPVENVRSSFKIELLIFIGIVVFGFIGLKFFHYAKGFGETFQVRITSHPDKAVIKKAGLQLCPATPCDLKFTLRAPGAISVTKPGYVSKRVDIFRPDSPEIQVEKHIELMRVPDPIDMPKYFEACQEKREAREGYSSMNQNLEIEYCYRIPPRMPKYAKRSGHCQVKFDVDPEGYTENIRITSCTEDYFEWSAKHAVAMWRYLPEIRNGMPVRFYNVENKVTFRLTDENGTLIPEPRATD